jgi:type II secretory pathway predicted ATPase ExeA
LLSRGLCDHEILLLLTGAAGVGKSVVLNATLAALADEPILMIHLNHPDPLPWSQRELASRILGWPADAPIFSRVDDTITAAIEELTVTNEGSQVVIAVDDAQTLTDDAMEFLLRLASPVRGSKVPPQLLLVGRGAFWERQLQGQFQVITRLAQVVSIEPLEGNDAHGYIASRLRLAGGSINDTTDEALAEILAYSAGFPERINTIISTSLAIGVCRGSRVLTGDIVEAAAASLASPPVFPDFLDGFSMFPAAAGSVSRLSGSEQLESDVIAAEFLDPSIVADSVSSSRLPPDQAGFSLDGTDPPGPAATSSPVAARVGAALAPVICAAGPPAEAADHGPGGAMTESELAPAVPPVEPSFSNGALQLHPPPPRPGGSWRNRAMAASILVVLAGLASVTPEPRAYVQEVVPAMWSRGSALLGQASTVRIRSLIASTASAGDILEAAVTAIRTAVAHVTAPSAADQPRPLAQAKPSDKQLEAGAADVGAAIPRTEIPTRWTASDAIAPPAPAMETPGPGHAAPNTGNQVATVPAAASVASPEAQRAEATPFRKLAAQAPPSAEMVAFLLRLGDVMLRQGDILSARSVYERAADAGSARGATGVGKTYDPEFLATVTAPGLKSDVTRAIEWYRLASTVRGDREAGERLQALTIQTAR